MPESSRKRKGHRHRSRKRKRARRKESRSGRDSERDSGDESRSHSDELEVPAGHGFRYGREVRAAQALTEINGPLRGDHYLLTARLPKVEKLRSEDQLHKTYKVDKNYLGRGDFSTVRKCIEIETGNEYAVKDIDKSFLIKRDPECVLKRTLFLEAACGTYLIPDHPNVVKVHKIYESPRKIYIVMDALGKWTLANSMAGIKPEEACAVFRKIVEAVAHVHEQGIVHCDLKGENFCLRNGQRLDPVLIDFGNAKPMILPEEDEGEVDVFKLLSPNERRHTVSRDIDMVALGTILEWMLTGKRDSPHARAVWAIKGTPPKFKPGVSAYAKDLLDFLQTTKERQMSLASDLLEHPWFLEGLEDAD